MTTPTRTSPAVMILWVWGTVAAFLVATLAHDVVACTEELKQVNIEHRTKHKP